MCAIGGFVLPAASSLRPPDLARRVLGLIERGSVRGADSFGVVSVSRSSEVRVWRSLDPPTVDDIQPLMTEMASVLIFSRAIPTPEWSWDATTDHIQPFCGDGWVTVHNGTIANDCALADMLGRPAPAVDSGVLPPAFGRFGPTTALAAVEGSYAVAAIDQSQPHRLHLARNFKPLVVASIDEVLTFASTAYQVTGRRADDFDVLGPRVERLPPYSSATANAAEGTITLDAVDRPDNHRTLAVISGGLDSVVAATQRVRAGHEVTLLHFTYGCRAEVRELEAVERVAQRLGCHLKVVDLRWMKELGGSSLLDADAVLADGEQGAEFPHEWVPARNTAMIAVAAAVADAEGHTEIVLGTNLEEGGAFPDNTQEFITAMSTAVELGTWARPRVAAPVGDLVKHRIVRLGQELDAPLDVTWSCYRGESRHCGDCGPCFMRRTAFEINGAVDPVMQHVDEHVTSVALRG